MEDKYTKEDVVEFAEYCSKFGCHMLGCWTPNRREEMCVVWKTTTELFDLWVKSKQETK